MDIIKDLLGKRVYFDTNILIYIIEGEKKYEDVLMKLLNAMGDHRVTCFSSELTIAEVFVAPLKKRQSHHVTQYSDFLNDDTMISLIPTTQAVYVKAALYRAQSRMSLPDAIHVASALEAECDVFLTNNRKIKVPKSITLVHL